MKVEESRIKDFLSRVNPKPCALCGTNAWYMFEETFYIQEFYNKKQLKKEYQQMPVIPISCPVCGNTLLVNAFISKIVSKEEYEFESKQS